MRRHLGKALLAVLCALAASSVHAASAAEVFCADASSSATLHDLAEDSAASLAALLDQVCGLHRGITNREPDLVNKAIQPWMSSDSGLAFLQDVDFKIKAFKNTEADETGLGFSYNYSKARPLNEYRYGAEGGSITGFAWNFEATGNVAFDRALNPGDFLDTRLSVSAFQHKGGFHQGNEAAFDRLNELEDRRADAETEQEMQRIDAESENILDKIREQLGTRRYLELDVNAGLESDQKFDQKQLTYGAQFAFDYKSYRRDAWQTMFNLFDWPFAALRMFTGYDPNERDFQPYGSTIPTVVLGLDRVDVENNEPREALTEDDRFNRFRSEVYFRTPVAHIRASEIWFNADWRYFREFDAPDAIEDANLDAFNYWTISLSASNGVFLSYRKGKLPFDLATEEAYEIGWKFNLAEL